MSDKEMKLAPYILVDFDRTLAEYDSWEKNSNALGMPIAPNVERVRRWREGGMEVRIFTARAASNNPRLYNDLEAIGNWCREVFGEVLPITNQKDFGCVAILDDLAIGVMPNVGIIRHDHELDPLSIEEEIELAKAY